MRTRLQEKSVLLVGSDHWPACQTGRPGDLGSVYNREVLEKLQAVGWQQDIRNMT